MTEPDAGPPTAPRRGRVLPGFVATLAAGALVVAFVVTRADDPSSSPSTTTSAPSSDRAGPSFSYEGTRYLFPPPAPSADAPLGTPPTDVDPTAPHVFSATQEGSDDPVAWDPCRPITYVVDDRRAPDGGARLLTEALAQVSRATGLQLEDQGPADEEPTASRPPVRPDGEGWAPVLIAWTDPEATPDLAGVVGGQGGNVAVRRGDGPRVYVTGTLLLDGPQLQQSLEVDRGSDQVRSVILHEMAHVIGLGHIDDPAELMYPEGQLGVITYGAGDRAGLARLGQGPCVPEL